MAKCPWSKKVINDCLAVVVESFVVVGSGTRADLNPSGTYFGHMTFTFFHVELCLALDSHEILATNFFPLTSSSLWPPLATHPHRRPSTEMLPRLAGKSLLRSEKNLMKFRSFASLCGLSSLLRLSSTTAFAPSVSRLTTTLPKSLPGLAPPSYISTRNFHCSTVLMAERKAGVSSPEELKAFVEEADDKLLVVDVRNPDASVEPGDQKSLAVAGLPSATERPHAQHLIWDRSTDSMPLPDVPKDTPIITHCGGGGRGQKAKDFLMKNGFTKVLNGGGPKETDCWAEFGSK